jgi:hypothetical protein
MRLRISAAGVFLALIVPACAAAPRSFMQSVRQLDGNHVFSVVAPDQLSPYQRRTITRFASGTRVDELMALETTYPGGGRGGTIEIVRTGKSAELRYIEEQDSASQVPHRFFTRTLDSQELARVRSFISMNHLDQLPGQPFGAFDGVEYRWTHATGPAGFQAVINNPGHSDQPMIGLVALMKSLRNVRPLTCIYTLPLPKGAELIYANPLNTVRRIWADGDDIRALVGPSEMSTENWLALRRGQWLRCDPPPSDIFKEPDPPDARNLGMSVIRFSAPWRGSLVATGWHASKQMGTWLLLRGKKPEQLLDAMLEYPVLVPDSNLLIGTLHNQLTGYDLAARKKIPLAEDLLPFQAFQYLPEIRFVLLVHRFTAPYGRPDHQDEWRLLNPATLESTKIDFDYWAQQAYSHPQALESTEIPGIFWTAFPSPRGSRTYIWRFDRNTLKILNLNEIIIDTLLFDTQHMWIDEKRSAIYAIHEGQLFRLPLPAATRK